jgi:GST-like protein
MLLEELHAHKGVEYDAWKISIFDLEQFGSDFVALNPNSKIPCMADHDFDPPLRVFESGHILKVRRPTLTLHTTTNGTGARDGST